MYNETQSILEAIFQARWSSTSVQRDVLGVPLKAPTQFENVPFDENVEHDFIYRPVVEIVNPRNIGLGASCIRYTGSLKVSVFHRPGSGLVTALKACDDIVAYFTNKTYQYYEFTECSVRKLPIDSDGWVQMLVVCPFSIDVRS